MGVDLSPEKEMGVDLSPAKKASSGYRLLWVLAGNCKGGRFCYTLDTNVHFIETSSACTPKYMGLTKATRPSGCPPPSPPSPTFPVGRCSRHRHLHFHLRVCRSSKAKTKTKRSGPVLPPLLPPPDFESTPFPRHRPPLPLPANAAVAALGSKIYVIGGAFSYTTLKLASDLPRAVFAYDTRNPASPPQISSHLNCGKSWPIACAINGKIYVMPFTFSTPPTPIAGLYFECFDPESNSWTILPDPPFVGSVMSHVVVGSHLLISIGAGGVYRFDTSRPDRGWKKIRLSLQHHTHPLVLDFLPFANRLSLSCSVREGLLLSEVVCDGFDVRVFDFLTKTLKMRRRALYVCSFDDMDALSDPETELIGITIKPVIGFSRMSLGWQHFTRYACVSSVSRIEDGVVMYANHGFEDRKCRVGLYYGFDMLRIDRVLNQGGEFYYKASSISWAFFRAKHPNHDSDDDTMSVLVTNEDGNFST